MSNLYRVLTNPLKGSFFIYVLVLNLVSNYVSFLYQKGVVVFFAIFFISAFFSYVESFLFTLFRRHWQKVLCIVFFTCLHTLFIVVEYFLLFNFQTIITVEVINILFDTNPTESSNFISTYLSPQTLVVYILFAMSVIIAAWMVSKIMENLNYKVIALVSVIAGFSIIMYCSYMFAVYRNGMSIPQYTSLSRALYSIYVLQHNKEELVSLRQYNEKVKAEQNDTKKPTIIVIIGESMSVYHSSLYGYLKDTNPLLSKRIDNKELLTFDNVVSLYDHTTSSIESVFSLDSMRVDYAKKALFPICFKKAGYNTKLYDNQYLVGYGNSILTDKYLSEMMFDFRNTKRTKYDGEMIEEITTDDNFSLYIIHLYGQHYMYKERFPEKFTHFKAEDYEGDFPLTKKQIIADYDNAMRYNDYVVDMIFNKFENQYCCAFYFSDHGEEVFDIRDYIGHGNAGPSPNLNYQIRIPLMVWFSPSFLSNNQMLYNKMQEAVHTPICIDDIGHTILDVAGITATDFVPRRSFVNPAYDKRRHRIVLHSVDYDSLWFDKR